MALIPKYHSVVGQYPVDPADVSDVNAGLNLSTKSIIQGMMVGINSSGYIKRANSSSAAVIGIAGDTLHSSRGYNAYNDSLVVNSAGSRKYTQNRVSDYFNETLGSGLMSVYLVGGEFYTDQTTGSFTAGGAVHVANDAGVVNGAASGTQVGRATTGLINYPSGVPGVDGGSSTDYSMPLATQFVGFILNI